MLWIFRYRPRLSLGEELKHSSEIVQEVFQQDPEMCCVSNPESGNQGAQRTARESWHSLLGAPLGSHLPEQIRAFNPSSPTVILCTNIAETSVTVNNVTAVVDSGLVRENRLD